MSFTDSPNSLLAACGGDTVKLFDVNVSSGDPCTLSYTPTPGCQVNAVKWNHSNLVLASAGDDKKISLWRKNGKSLGTLQLSGNDPNDLTEESILAISFCSKSSPYLCSGGTGRIVRIWDLRKKICIKKLSGHSGTISGVMYNCKDEHLASISLKGDLILHNLASGAKAAEIKDPNGQELRVLDYSRFSRHLLVTAGDDGSIHLWDTTGRNPKVSWLKQHSAPTTGVYFSPTSDKMIASVGLDKKLYTFDSASKRPTFCAAYEAPFSSMAYSDDGHTLAAGTNSGRVVFYDVRGKPQAFTVLRAYNSTEAITSLSWQRSKPNVVNESNCSDDNALLGDTGEDFVLMPDPLPSAAALTFSAVNKINSRNSSTPTSIISSVIHPSVSEETPQRTNQWAGTSLSRLQATRSHDFKDDMDVFSPLVDVQPITPSLNNVWDEHEAAQVDDNQVYKKTTYFSTSIRRFPYSDSDPIPHSSDWKLGTSTVQGDNSSLFSQNIATPVSSSTNESPSSATPPEAWGGNVISDKLKSRIDNVPVLSRGISSGLSSVSVFSGLQDAPPLTGFSLRNSSGGPNSMFSDQQPKLTVSREILNRNSESSFAFSTTSTQSSFKTSDSLSNLELPPSISTRRFSTYAERLSTASSSSDGTTPAVSSPKNKKTGTETRADLTSVFHRQDSSGTAGTGNIPPSNGSTLPETQRPLPSTDYQQGISSFSLQLVQRTLEETLGSVQKSIHDDVKNLHIELLRQFHMQEMEMASMLNTVLERQDELMREVQSLRRENQQLRQLL